MARKTRMDEMKKDLHKAQAEARVQVMAVVGATDLAVEKVREAQERFVAAAKDLDAKSLQKEVKKAQKRLEDVQEELSARVARTAKDVQAAPANAIGHGIEIATKAQSTVEELAARGEALVRRIRNQQATTELRSQIDTTVSAGKGAVTTARKAAAETERAARATLKTAAKEAKVVAHKVAETVEKDAEVAAKAVRESAARTRASARRTQTTAKSAAKRTSARTKATTTGVRKTATKASKASKAAAKKVGD